jgi:asparagine synthase (glutamine-hydrolysing)
MCGIAGIYSNEGVSVKENLELLSDALVHRGPDAFGYYTDGPVGLVHRRLSIIDLSHDADQPMVSHNGRYHMVYNGEVYNFPEIRKELEEQGVHEFRTHSDSEVILEAFSLWSCDFVNHLNGMFALAIYDKEEKILFLFRDHIGIKPLFVFRDGKTLAFASELKALLAVPYIRRKISYKTEAIAEYLHLGYIPEPHTAWDNIQKFPSGSYAKFDGNEFIIIPYWKPEKLIGAQTFNDEQQAVEQLNELLISSVKMRLVSDVPFGTFLSGGIDSSLVTAIAQKVHGEKINTFSVGFKESTHDESPYARAVASHLKTIHHEFMVTEKEAMDLLPELTDVFSEPFADSSAIPTLLVSSLARQQVTMTLSGDGGDELFMGYGAYRWAQRLASTKWKLLRKPVSVLLKAGNIRQKRIADMLRHEGHHLNSHIFSQEQYLFSAHEVSKMLVFPCEYAGDDLSGTEFSRQLLPEELQSFYDLTHYLKDDLLVKVDRASMHCSLETRVPLLDNRIIEFAVNLDPSLRLYNNTGKYLLKKVLYKYLPEHLFNRPKRGFAVPLNKWMKGPLGYLINDYLSPEIIKKHQVINPEAAAKLVARYKNPGNDHLYNRVWSLIVLHIWLESTRT